MRNPSLIARTLTGLRAIWFGLFLALSFAGCAIGQVGGVVDHGFAFNVWKDSPGIELLQYRYGESSNIFAQSHVVNRATGETNQSGNTSGPMRIGKDLYVKWRIKKTGEVFEDSVDLQKQWPRSMQDLKIYFIIEDRQLYVYLITELKERPYFKPEQADEINSFSSSSPRQKTLRKYALRYIDLIYPVHELDPHLPPELRRK